VLHFTRMKAAAILLTVFVVCSFAVPNFFSEETVKNWPAWAQRRLVLSPDLQGGTSAVLQVDKREVRLGLLKSLQREVGKTLHEARISLVNLPAVRADSVEVRLHESDFGAGFAELRKLSRPFNGVRSVDVVDAGDGLVRLTPTEAAVTERTRQTVDQSVPIIEKRINELGLVGPTVQRQGSDRILVQAPGLGGDPQRPWRTLGMLFQ
jgi:preprotein translocase subunit SecD